MKCKTINLLEKRRKPSGSRTFRLHTHNTKSIVHGRKKIDLFKIQKLCSAKDHIKRIKKQVTEWEKIVANHIFDKKLGSRIY